MTQHTGEAARPTVVAAMAREFARRNIRRVFGLPGEDHMGLLAEIARAGIEYVSAREETAACMMACVEAQRSGTPAVVIVTMAPGLTNAINGIANAYLDQLPLLVVCGQHPVERESTIIRQHLDNRTVVQGVTKGFFAATRSIHHDLSRALATATDGSPGPVLLELREEVASATSKDAAEPWAASVAAATASWRFPSEIAHQLASASRPALVIGARPGADRLDAQVKAISARLRAPVFVTPSAIGRTSPQSPWYAGTFLNGNLEAAVLAASDAVLAVDLRANEIFNRPWPYVPIIALSERPGAERFFPVRHEVSGSVTSLLASLEEQLTALPSNSAWTVDEVSAYRCQVDAKFVGDEGFITIPQAVRLIRKRMPRNTPVAVDAGFGKPLLAYLWSSEDWPTYFTSAGLSTMGYAIPAANALQLATGKERRVLAFMGDGSLLMRASEISVAAELGLPCVYVAWMDASLTQIAIKQRRAGLSPIGTSLPTFSCRLIAEAFGATGYDVTSATELATTLDTVLDRSEPALIGVHVDQARSNEWFELLRG